MPIPIKSPKSFVFIIPFPVKDKELERLFDRLVVTIDMAYRNLRNDIILCRIDWSDLKVGATQVASGAIAGELWRTSGHATLPDNVVMVGV